MLNKIWISFFLVSFISCLYQAIFLGNVSVFGDVIDAIFSMAQTAVTIAIGLIVFYAYGLGCLLLLNTHGSFTSLVRAWRRFFRD